MTIPGTVTVGPRAPMGRLLPATPGLSFEKTHLTDNFFTGSNAPLIALFKLIGPSILRIGGNAVDLSHWMPSAMPAAPGMTSPNIGTVDVDSFADFLKATGWKVIYGINLNTSSPMVAADEAKYAAGKLGDSLYAFEIGNEVSYFGAEGAIAPKWASFASAIKMAVPTAAFSGPDNDGAGNVGAGWSTPFASAESSYLVLLTQHYYRGSGATGTMAKMLAYPDTMLIGEAQQLGKDAASNKIRDGFRFTETNSFVLHGTPGVSNAFGAALWSIDHMLTIAEQGGAGVNFHGGGPNQDLKHLNGFNYTPIQEANSQVTGVNGVFYGMQFVSLAGTGNTLTATAKAGPLNFSAYAIAQADGATNVVLVNKDVSGVQTTIDMGAPVSSASAIYLLAPNLTATTGITLAGSPIMPNGIWNTSKPFKQSVMGNTVSVLVPATSAVLVHVK
jgi:hypothetical protein